MGVPQAPGKRARRKIAGYAPPNGGHQDTRTTGHTAPDADGLDTWRATMQAIHDEVMARGWSERLGAFRQHYDGEGLDASVLLIPLMGFLSADHPRVRSTVEAIERHLTVNGLVHRFAPAKTPGEPDEPLEDFEGAFLPCTFWLASVYAQMGHLHHAEAILQQVEALAGELGIFAEEADARDGTFLGNTPLLFAQTEYARAILEIASRHPLDKARLALGALENRFEHRLGGEA